MKKILLSIALCFGIVAITTSANAQNDGTTPARAVEHSVGSIHGFKVNLDGSNDPLEAHKDNFYTWKVFSVDGTTVTQLTDFSKFQFVTYNPKGTDVATKFGGNIGTNGVYSAQKAYGVGVQWLDVLASGVYAVEVEEYNSIDASSCSARRRFYISVSNGGVDFMLAALNPADDAEFTGAAGQSLTTCNSFSGELVSNDGSHTLGNTSVFYKISMKTGTQAWNGAWGFDYDLANANGTGLAIEVLNGVTGTSVGSADLTNKKIAVDAGNPTAYVKITFANVLGTPGNADITFNLSEKNAAATSGNTTAYITTASAQQFESFEKAAGNKEATSFVIKASPDVQAIVVD
ncbi:MAG: hypothetical protein ACEPOZ_00185 [Marinifilaceae bacterium]